MTLGSLPVDGFHTAASNDRPELDGAVQGAADDACVIELETGDSVLVPSQSHHTVASKRPHLQVVTSVILGILLLNISCKSCVYLT